MCSNDESDRNRNEKPSKNQNSAPTTYFNKEIKNTLGIKFFDKNINKINTLIDCKNKIDKKKNSYFDKWIISFVKDFQKIIFLLI